MKKRTRKNNLCPAGDYHWDHTHIRHRLSPHFLDFDHYPLAHKPYGQGGRITPEGPVHGADDLGNSGIGLSSMEGLFRLLFLAYGVISSRQMGKISLFQRSVPSAGGLYPCHLYLGIPGGKGGLETGVYYYDPVAASLVHLRQGITPSAAPGDMLFLITASFYNSAWKYRGRAYRYMLLDGGHLAENLCLLLTDFGVDHDLSYDFDDKRAGALLGIDPDKEAVLATVSVGTARGSELLDQLENQTRPDFPGLETDPAELRYMTGYDLLPRAHALGGEVRDRGGGTPMRVTLDDPVFTPAIPGGEKSAQKTGPDLEQTILTRRSRRNFAVIPVPAKVYQSLFHCVGAVDRYPDKISSYRFLRMGMICQNLEGLADGFYLFDRDVKGLCLMRQGPLARPLAKVCLDQAWIGRAAVTFLFLSDLEALEKAYGARGYRYTMLTAGRMAQQIYLGAEALGLGCCGIGAIYDLEAKGLLGLRENSALVYAVSTGPLKARSGHGN